MATVNEPKHLGPILNSALLFDKHLNEKFIKAKKNLEIVKHPSTFLPLNTLHQMYKALVRHIPSKQDQFCEILYSLMETAERIQYQAALAITSA